MNSNQLSKRLYTLATFVPKGSTVADIGSDHAYLPCFLIHHQVAKRAIAGEIVEGPYQSARRQVIEDELDHLIEVRKGNGLAVIDIGEVEVVTIAGMGGPLIAQILEEGKDKLNGVKRLILQPNVSAISIREWLIANGWLLIEEAILQEDGKIYEVLVAEQSEQPVSLTYSERLLGPYLIQEKSSVFQLKWQQEYNQWDRIKHQIDQAGKTIGVDEKKKELHNKMKIVQEVLQWEKR